MASIPIRDRPRLSIQAFRGFLEGRPEEEHWQLIDGVAVMMTAPTKAHQRIASNLERLLNDALAVHAPSLTAYQAVGVNIGPRVQYYDPEPDVVVVDLESDDERYSDRFYLAAEIVSASDRQYVESKREVYKLHDWCKCVLTIQRDRFQMRIDRRTETGWQEEVLKMPLDTVLLSEFGLSFALIDLYRGTSLASRESSS
jgi:Uma2 family endonuclease